MQSNINPCDFEDVDDEGFYIFSDCGKALYGPFLSFDEALVKSSDLEDVYIDWM